jgi:hypothetical protein
VDRLGIAGLHRDDGTLYGEWQRLGDEFPFSRVGERTVVRCDEEVAAFRDLDLAEECAGAAVLQVHLDTEFLPVGRGDGLDRLLESGRAIDGQGRLATSFAAPHHHEREHRKREGKTDNGKEAAGHW